MKRAVGRGPVVDGPRDFFRIGCGVAALLDTLDDVVLGRLLFRAWRLRAVVLEAPDPPGRDRFYRIQLSMGTLLLASSTYPGRRPLVAVGRSAQRHEALAVGDGRK